MAIVELVLQLGAGHADLFAVDHNDEVTVVHVRSEFGLVLAAEAMGDLSGETAEDLVLSVNHIPLAIDVGRLRAESFHENISCPVLDGTA